MSSISDQEILLLVKENARCGFDHLYNKYSRALLLTIYRIIGDKHTAEDILQEAFISIWVNIDQYNPDRGCIYTWVRNVAKNKAIDFMRSGLSTMRGKTDSEEGKINTPALQIEQKIEHIGGRFRRFDQKNNEDLS